MKKSFSKIMLLSGALAAAAAMLGGTRARAATIDDLNPTFGDFYTVVNHLMDRIPYFLGGLAFLALLYSGAIYITSFGDPTRMESAKKNLTWTAIGIIAVVSIFAVMKIILWLTSPAPLGP